MNAKLLILTSVFLAGCATAQVKRPPFIVSPESTAAPAYIDMLEASSNGANRMRFLPPTSMASDLTLQFPKWTGGLVGTTGADDFVGTRKVNFVDQSGASQLFFDAYSTVTVGAGERSLVFRDNAGTELLKFYRQTLADGAVDYADVFVDLLPNSNLGQSLGSASKKWLVGGMRIDLGQIDLGANGWITSNQFKYSDGAFDRVTITGAGAGSNAGNAIIVKDAAGTNQFYTSYGGTTYVNNLTVGGTCTGCGGGSLPVVDTTSIVKGNVDATKELQINVDTAPAATTVTANLPGGVGVFTFAGADISQTWSQDQYYTADLFCSTACVVGDTTFPFGAFTSTTAYYVYTGGITRFSASAGSTIGRNAGGTTTWTLNNTTGGLFLNGLTGGGNAYVCVDAGGNLFRGGPGC